MTLENIKLSIFLSTLFLTLVIFTPPVSAVERPNATTTPQARMQKVQARLTEAKLKSCQARENSINKRSSQLVKMATNMLEKFDAIAGRVKTYYTEKVVSSGKTVTNYDSLVTDIQTKKTAVQTALSTTQTNVATFTCKGEDPKGQLTQFRTDMQTVKTALKDYRTSVKNLIVAVRSVTGETEKNVTPEPTKTGGTE